MNEENQVYFVDSDKLPEEALKRKHRLEQDHCTLKKTRKKGRKRPAATQPACVKEFIPCFVSFF